MRSSSVRGSTSSYSEWNRLTNEIVYLDVRRRVQRAVLLGASCLILIGMLPHRGNQLYLHITFVEGKIEIAVEGQVDELRKILESNPEIEISDGFSLQLARYLSDHLDLAWKGERVDLMLSESSISEALFRAKFSSTMTLLGKGLLEFKADPFVSPTNHFQQIVRVDLSDRSSDFELDYDKDSISLNLEF